MGRRRFEGGLANAVAIAACLLLGALFLWIPAVALVDPGDCPRGQTTGEGRYVPTGLDVPRSLWPPGVACHDFADYAETAGSGAEREHVQEIFPGARWVPATLIFAAVLALLGGVLAEIRALRRNREVASDPRLQRS